MSTIKRAHCAFCGEDIGEWDRFTRRTDTCGKGECVRWARDNDAQERAEAHEQLVGWDR